MKKIFTLLLIIGFLCTGIKAQAQIYVNANATGSNSGANWTNAYVSLQDAIANAVSGDEIWVAAGTYKPSAYPTGCTGCSSDRDFTFQLRDGISLYGGFAGNETQLSERDIEANPSILSGDIGTVGGNSDNVYHVVLSAFSNDTPTTRLDGFTVTGGNANGGFTSISVNGAAVFRRNGGGITTRFGTNTLNNNTLSGNTASNYGGGIYTSGGITTLTNNTLSENTADRGGGILTLGGTITLTNNILSENMAFTAGGGFYLWNSDNTLTNNTLIGNLAFTAGGGIYIQQQQATTSTLTNNTLSGNVSNNSGGGIYIQQGTITLTNNTLSGNRANSQGGGIYNFFANTTITNSIIWGNVNFSGNASEIVNQGNLPTVSNSIIQGGFTGGTDIINLDPLFVSPITSAPTPIGDLRLQLGSPAIDAGDNAAYQTATGTAPGSDTDLDGNARLMGSAIDMGAYEYIIVCPPASILYVDASATGNNNGSSWDDAFTDLQNALESNCTGVTQIWVAAGTYKPSAYPENCTGCSSDRDFTFQLRDGISLYGGFAGNETQLSERDIAANPSILSGDIGTVGDNSDNVYHVVLAAFSNDTPTTRLDGFSITAGNANVDTAILVNGANVFRRNGGGVTTLFGTNTLINNILSGNSAIFGGGIFTNSGINNLTNNTLSGNLADTRGGGMYTQSGNNTLTNNTLSGNSATSGGGGIFNFGGTHILSNNIIWGNTNGSGSTSEIGSSFATITVSNSIIPGVLLGATDSDPLFVTPITAAAPTTTGDLRLQLGSPAIDAGDNTDFQDATGTPPGNATDLDGNARLVGSAIDMGAYENFDACPPAAILYVDASATGDNNGGNWENAFTDLQSALVVSNCPGVTQIWVAAGTYKPSAYPENCTGCSTNGDFTFQLRDGISLYGGFAGNETQLSERDIAANPSILSGDIGTVGDNSDNVYHVVLSAFADDTQTTRLDGFTVTGGNANGSSVTITVNGEFISRRHGGGIYTPFGTNTLTNNTLSGNMASSDGGGIYTPFGTNTLTNNTLSGNSASNTGGGIYTFSGINILTNNTLSGNSAITGGGIYTFSGTNTLTNNTLSGNVANSDGGGIYIQQATTSTLTNNTLSGNVANIDGGGIYIQQGTSTLTNNTLSGNVADNNGGGIYTQSGNNTLTNNTLSGNRANNQGGGIYNSSNNNTITNSIIWGNIDSSGNASEIVDQFISLTASNSIIRDGYTGTDIIDQDPLFVTPIAAAAPTTTGDLRLQLGSPAIDAGDNTAYQTATGTPPGSDTDLDGNARLVGSTIDMGPYETKQSTWSGVVSEDWVNTDNWENATVPDAENPAIVKDISQNTPRIYSTTTAETSGVFIGATGILEVEGVLKVTERLDNNGILRFLSNSSATGQFDEFNGTISGSGEVRVERYIPQSNRAFRYISSSVNTSSNINANLQEGVTNADTEPNPNPGYGTHITGGTTANGFDATGTNNPSMFEWNEPTQAWVAVTNTNPKTMQVGEAYALMIRGDRSTDLTNNIAAVTPTTLRLAGNLHTGDYSVPSSDLSSTLNQWNLVANPYQALVNTKTLLQGSDATDLDENYIYIYDPTLGTRGGYATVDLSLSDPTSTPYDSGIGGSTDADENLLPNQAFFVKTTGPNPSLTFKENYKNVTANFATTFSQGNPLTELNINLKRQPENSLVDGVSLRFDASYSNTVNTADADKFWNFDERVAIVNEEQYLAIEKRALPENGDEIQLYIGNYVTDDYEWQINMNNMQREAVLYDSYLATEIPINLNMLTNIDFSIDENIPESVNPLRFSIRFTQETLGVADELLTKLMVYPNPITKNKFSIHGLFTQEMAALELFDMTGKLVYQTKVNAEEETLIELDGVLPVGVYQLKVEQNQATHHVKLIIAK